MTKLPFLPLIAFIWLAGFAAAQKDSIVFTDGSVAEGITVVDFTLRDIQWRAGSKKEVRSTDQVADIVCQKVREEYRRAYAERTSAQGPGNFLDQAKRLDKKPFLAQFGYVEAFRLFAKNEQWNDAFACLEELGKACPQSGFLPMQYREKLDYYLGTNNVKNAQSVAQKYLTDAQIQGFPTGFSIEAEFYQIMADKAAGELDLAALRSRLGTVLQKSAAYPDITARVRLQLADADRLDNKPDAAEKIYRQLVEADGASEEVLGGAWLGLGHVEFQRGDPTNKEPYRKALLAFLRGYLEAKDGPPTIVAECLHMGAQAAEKWNGEDAGRMARSLRRRLNTDYPDNPWK